MSTFTPKSKTLPTEPLRFHKDTLVAYTCMPERKQTKCLSKGVYFQNALAKCHWRPYYEIPVLYDDTLPCATLRKMNQCMLGKLFLLVKHHIRVPSECQTVWLQFTVQVRSLLGLIWVQTVATAQTDKDLNVSFCRQSIYFQKLINCTCAYHMYAANRFFRHFHNLRCEEQRLW